MNSTSGNLDDLRNVFRKEGGEERKDPPTWMFPSEFTEAARLRWFGKWRLAGYKVKQDGDVIGIEGRGVFTSYGLGYVSTGEAGWIRSIV